MQLSYLPQSFELFEAGAIFTADHVLDMQQIHRGYALELDRKQTLTKCLYYTRSDPKTARECLSIRCESSNLWTILVSNLTKQIHQSMNTGGRYDGFSASLEDISKILQEYDDDSAQSHINGDLGAKRNYFHF